MNDVDDGEEDGEEEDWFIYEIIGYMVNKFYHLFYILTLLLIVK